MYALVELDGFFLTQQQAARNKPQAKSKAFPKPVVSLAAAPVYGLVALDALDGLDGFLEGQQQAASNKPRAKSKASPKNR